MNKEEFNLTEFINREFYIVDCKDFIYFPRKVKIVEFSIGYNCPIEFYINIKGYGNEYKMMYKEELERFKSFDEARKYADELNELPENKAVAETWNSPKNKYRMLIAQKELRGVLDE